MAVFATVVAGRIADSNITVSISGSVDSTLSTDQLLAKSITISAALSASLNVFFPAAAGDAGAWWWVTNSTSGAYAVTIKNTTGSGVVLAQGKTAAIRWNGTSMEAIPTDSVAAGFAKSGGNSDITSLTGLTGGISGTGGASLSGAFGGNAGATAPFSFARAAVSFATDADHTCTAAEYACPVLDCTSVGSLTATRKLILPIVAGAMVIVSNGTSGSQLIQVIGSSGTGVLVGSGRRATCYCDGTNWMPADNDNVDLSIGGGTVVTKLVVYTPSLSPALVNANTTAEQTFAVSGLLLASDTILTVSKPTAQAGLGIVGWRVTANDTLGITFCNDTAGGLTPTATQTYRIVALRS